MKSKRLGIIFFCLMSIFSTSIFSYICHFTRLYRPQDGTTVDLISDVHVEEVMNCSITNLTKQKYKSLFTSLKVNLGDDLGIFWEKGDPQPESFIPLGELLYCKKADFEKEISNDELACYFNKMCLAQKRQKIENMNFEVDSGLPSLLLNLLAWLEGCGAEIVRSDCYRRRIYSFGECSVTLFKIREEGLSTTTGDYFLCFMSFKMFFPDIARQFDEMLAKECEASQFLEKLHLDYLDYKNKVLQLIGPSEFENFIFNLKSIPVHRLSCEEKKVVDEWFSNSTEKIKELFFYYAKLTDFEMLFKMLSSPSKRKILYAGAVHCKNIAEYLVEKYGFVKFIDLGEVFDEEGGSSFFELNYDLLEPEATFQKDVDGVTKYFSFKNELPFKILKQALLEDPKISLERRFGSSYQDNQPDLEDPPTRSKRKIDEVTGPKEEREENKKARGEGGSARPRRTNWNWCNIL